MAKNIWLLSGVPSSGKSTWARENFGQAINSAYISRDDIRFSLLEDGDEYFAKETAVWNYFIANIKEACRLGMENIVVDATHLNDKARFKVLDEIDTSKYEITIVIFDVPLQVCLERNSQRNGRAVVPENKIRDMYRAFQKYSDKWDYIVVGE